MSGPNTSTGQELDYSSFRASLEEKRDDIIGRLRDRDDIIIERVADPLDELDASQRRTLTVERLAQESEMLRQVESALRRFETGEYGICATCEEPIPVRRLKAVPWATMCVSCREAEERHRASGRGPGDFDDDEA